MALGIFGFGGLGVHGVHWLLLSRALRASAATLVCSQARQQQILAEKMRQAEDWALQPVQFGWPWVLRRHQVLQVQGNELKHAFLRGSSE